MQSDAPTAPSRREPRVRALLVLGALACAGCEYIPPFLERNYLRVGAQGLSERLQAEEERAEGPYPGVSLTLGSQYRVSGTRATAVEAEAQVYDLDYGGDFDGYGFRYLAGLRWFWNMDGRWRPHAGVGLQWTDFHLEDHDRKYDPKGPGCYGDVGLDWMITPRHAVGARLRSSLRYEEASHEHGLKAGLEIGLQSVWRF